MAYDINITAPWFRIKHQEKEYPWPSASDPDGKIIISGEDVLICCEDSTFMKRTGLCCIGIVIPEEDLLKQTEAVSLRVG